MLAYESINYDMIVCDVLGDVLGRRYGFVSIKNKNLKPIPVR